jgi:hypothetical protein
MAFFFAQRFLLLRQCQNLDGIAGKQRGGQYWKYQLAAGPVDLLGW